jgi:hypothetical protein
MLSHSKTSDDAIPAAVEYEIASTTEPSGPSQNMNTITTQPDDIGRVATALEANTNKATEEVLGAIQELKINSQPSCRYHPQTGTGRNSIRCWKCRQLAWSHSGCYKDGSCYADVSKALVSMSGTITLVRRKVNDVSSTYW